MYYFRFVTYTVCYGIVHNTFVRIVKQFWKKQNTLVFKAPRRIVPCHRRRHHLPSLNFDKDSKMVNNTAAPLVTPDNFARHILWATNLFTVWPEQFY